MEENRKIRILFVDDEPDILRGVRRMLRAMREEWDVDFVTSAAKALEKMAEAPIDVLVTDMRMPEMDGSQLLEKVVELYPSTIRFILSGQSQDEVIYRSVGPAHQFLAKPCNAEMIKNTIIASLALRKLMKSENVIKIVAKVEHLPTVPQAYINITEELRKKEPSMHRVAEIIEQDIGMSSKILQLVNSSFFGIPNHIASISHAVNFLGVDVVRSLTLTVGAFSKFKLSPRYEAALMGIIDHCMLVATCAKDIARAEKGSQEDEDNTFAAGLLHMIGEVIFMSYMPKEYREAHDQMKKQHISLVDAEEAIFGASYAEVGAFLLGIWGLKNVITEAIVYHLKPSECLRKNSLVLTALHASRAILDEIKNTSSTDEDSVFVKLDMNYVELAGKSDRIQQWREICSERSKGGM